MEYIFGVDEVGYGAIAGPLYICCLKFLREPEFSIFDSKVISEKKRLILFDKIISISEFKIGVALVEEIVKFGLGKAYKMALQRALDGAVGSIFIDGKFSRGFDCIPIIKGDSFVPVISAASIVAKVLRDRYMLEISFKYPFYFFEKNKGYGTKRHIQVIRERGVCSEHRINYSLFSSLNEI